MKNINFSELESIEGIAPLYIYGLGAFFLKQYYIDALAEKAYNEPGSLTQSERELIKALADMED